MAQPCGINPSVNSAKFTDLAIVHMIILAEAKKKYEVKGGRGEEGGLWQQKGSRCPQESIKLLSRSTSESSQIIDTILTPKSVLHVRIYVLLKKLEIISILGGLIY